ncbi:glycosyltransferase family 4 protein [Nocardioides sp. YIM 152588]|uniref:glycosyltransferase family 4 protein n=1 Tax=Nocardioides sp. YIM 152588 TaxID=3158259 RepID=UPI0032E46890
MPVRVLTLIDAFRMGGAETLLAPLAVAARDAGLELDIVAVGPASHNAAKTVEILRDSGIEPRNLGVKRLLDPTAVPRLVAEIRRSRCDVVHAHLEMAMTLAVPAAAIARRPAVCTFHHVQRPLEGRAAQRERLAVAAATRSRGAVFVSQASLDSFHRAYRPTATPPNWSVVHNGIDLTLYRPGPADPEVRAALGGGAEHVVVVPAAFRDFKGIPVALSAWPAVRARFPDAVLALVGGGELEDDLRKRVADLGLHDAVRFAGVRSDMPDVYRAADVVLLPSTHGENLPTVVMEAGASGKPVVASAIGGIPDMVVPGETGLLVPPHDPAAIADAVAGLLADSPRSQALGAAAATHVDAHFSARAWVGNLRALYYDAVR